MSIKLIAVDIDGTLVNSQKEITPEVFSAIQDAKEAGVKVVIATGRPHRRCCQTSGRLAVERPR
ncbi:hydrolase [Streptococcus pneumoniae]|nr:hydrolase [Streptococcus pneumoniae]VNM43528.1 hydrolase [Streptococcus pneumoniae]VQX46717.1 hydrolase [Streptococcus pneumoniae]